MSDASKDIDQIFWEALQIKSVEARAIFLDQACGDDEQLRRLGCSSFCWSYKVTNPVSMSQDL